MWVAHEILPVHMFTLGTSPTHGPRTPRCTTPAASPTRNSMLLTMLTAMHVTGGWLVGMAPLWATMSVVVDWRSCVLGRGLCGCPGGLCRGGMLYCFSVVAVAEHSAATPTIGQPHCQFTESHTRTHMQCPKINTHTRSGLDTPLCCWFLVVDWWVGVYERECVSFVMIIYTYAIIIYTAVAVAGCEYIRTCATTSYPPQPFLSCTEPSPFSHTIKHPTHAQPPT